MAILPSGVYAERYEQDKAIISTKLQWMAFIGFLVLWFALPLFVPIRFVSMLNIFGIVLIAVVGLQITTGYAGQVNLGQAAFIGVGAYVTAFLAHNFGLPFWLTILCGGVAAAAYGTIFGLPAVRVKGFYLALITIAALYIFQVMLIRIPGFGGPTGIDVPAATVGGLSIKTDTSKYYLIMTVAVIMIFFAYGIVRSRIGRAFTAIRDNDKAAQILGINLLYYKTMAFVIGTFYAGVAGGLWAYLIRYVTAEQFTLVDCLWYIGMVIVGGGGSILGAIFGVVFIRGVFELISWIGPMLAENLPGLSGSITFGSMNILLGATIILFLIFEPRGLVHRWNIFKNSVRIWPFPY